MRDRFVSATKKQEDIDFNLRPNKFDNYIGQEEIKKNLKIFIQAALERGDSLDHVLLYGPPGLGKTTLANIIANEMGADIKTTSGPAIEKPGDLAAVLTKLQPNDILFIDEIHRLNRVIEETLYPAMEDFALDIVIGTGPQARSIRLDLPPFTLIGATTKAGSLTSPLRDRFGVINRLQFYTEGELTQIILRTAKVLQVGIEKDGAKQIALRSRGTPRIANRFLKRVRDFAQIEGDGIITEEIAHDALDRLNVDKLGLDRVDRKMLKMIIEKFKGGPVGLGTLAAAINEERETIEDVYEPYLLQIGYLNRTPRGRKVTDLAYKHFNLELGS
ncbi:Holliday junction DNA helicase subunit RuvB [Orenia metallireducens]|jgi:Holliday junction DNA helicase RuvB|uniref:Holliday junction branch migration complex subunit RuvB n=1 Tax=Orenia metallireducens TaxID=1413210 RepID=A0A285G976_9FIRM|nr:Holliday junction branch migration DNA helicase RuvB [Orenia metallireducens]PRX28300.1 Holliday junction DNA helicase subunit RuvB [Orenia metallireducens]SNY19086.1 Holliday junction DNA helicase subunit RuvB [Orenia metallireducens]